MFLMRYASGRCVNFIGTRQEALWVTDRDTALAISRYMSEGLHRLEERVTILRCHGKRGSIFLLLVTGGGPVGRTMQRLLTGYAMDFNRRHRRSGRLYQNRFKSILCEREAYLLELVRYIHLNASGAEACGEGRGAAGMGSQEGGSPERASGGPSLGVQMAGERPARLGDRCGSVARSRPGGGLSKVYGRAKRSSAGSMQPSVKLLY